MHHALCTLHMHHALCTLHMHLAHAPHAALHLCALNLAPWHYTQHTHTAVCTCHVGGSCFLWCIYCKNALFVAQFWRVSRVQNAVLELLSRHLRAAHATKSMVAIDYCMLLHYQLLCRFKIKCIFDDVIVHQIALYLIIMNFRLLQTAQNKPYHWHNSIVRSSVHVNCQYILLLNFKLWI